MRNYFLRLVLGFSLLHLAVAYNKIDWVTVLLKNGANPNIQTKTGITPLHIVALRGSKPKSLVWLLLQYKADINALDYAGNTPFHHSLLYLKYLPFAEAIYYKKICLLNKESVLGTYLTLKQNNYSPFIDLERDLEVQFPFIKNVWTEYYYRKLCAHVYNIPGCTFLEIPGLEKPIFQLCLEGLVTPATFAQEIANYADKQSAYRLQQVELNHIVSFSSFLADDTNISRHDYLSRILSGKPTLLITGFWSHIVILLFWGEHLALCDAKNRQPLYYVYNPHKFREQHISCLRIEARDVIGKVYNARGRETIPYIGFTIFIIRPLLNLSLN